MKSKSLIYSLIALLTSITLSGLFSLNSTQAQTTNLEHNDHHPSKPTPTTNKEMINHAQEHFIEMMIPHHQQAVEMADIALTKAEHPEIKNLALAIKKDQSSEIEKMRTWYKLWYGKEVPVKTMNHQGMTGNDSSMCQQMNPDIMNCQMKCMSMDLETLKNAQEFDKEFIRQMIPHHTMAVKMSEKIVETTTKSEIRNLAESIIKIQTAEIRQMEQWYQTWYKAKPL